MEFVRMNRNELRIWFEDFSDWVKKGVYKKAPYREWSVLNTWTKYEDENPRFELRCENYILQIHSLDHSPNPLILNIRDDSLGTYLYDMMTDYIEYNNNKENEEMKNFGVNFDFGPVPATVRMSMYGMAIKNAEGTYVAYDVKNDSIMNVDILNFEGANKFMYKMPVAVKDVAKGDVVIHNGAPCFVQEVCENARFKVLDIFAGEEKTMVASKSMFNFDFITKVVSFIDFAGAANADNPFGNMLPFLLLNDGDRDNSTALAMAMMMNGGNMNMNPMMMYALMGGNSNDLLPLMLLGNFNKGE